MKEKETKRKRLKKAIKSTGRKVRDIVKSRNVTRFIPLFGLIAIFKPGAPVYALTIDGSH